MTGKKGSTHYQVEIKEHAVQMFLEEKMPYQSIAKLLEIRDPARIERWVSDYRKEGLLGLHKVKGRPRKVEDQAAYIARLEMENTLLKKFHAELRKLTKDKADTE